MSRTKEKRLKRQGKIIREAGLSPLLWDTLTERETCLIVKHRFAGEIRAVGK